jgi:hypothetical protein
MILAIVLHMEQGSVYSSLTPQAPVPTQTQGVSRKGKQHQTADLSPADL